MSLELVHARRPITLIYAPNEEFYRQLNISVIDDMGEREKCPMRLYGFKAYSAFSISHFRMPCALGYLFESLRFSKEIDRTTFSRFLGRLEIRFIAKSIDETSVDLMQDSDPMSKLFV